MNIETLQSKTLKIRQAILKHPFIKGLKDGSLADETFQYYLQQDALYLQDYARALALTAIKLETDPMQTFLSFATEAIQAEQDLQRTLSKTVTMTSESFACFSYRQFILKTSALEAAEVAIAALTPCFSIYAEVGHYLKQSASLNNPYQTWIDLYAGTDFQTAAQQASSILDDYLKQSSPSQQQKCLTAFVTASQLEWHFWNDALLKNTYHI